MSRRPIDLSVVVVSYETRAATLACLGALERARQAHPELVCETIVIDNGSRDGSPQALAARDPAVRLFALVRNRGFAAAVNLGLRAARGRHVLLLNSDAEIGRDVLVRGVSLLDGDPEIGVLGVALRHPDGRPQRCVHPLPDLQTELLPEPLLRRIRPRGFVPRPRSAAPRAGGVRAVEAVRGAVFFLRGAWIEKLGPFDEGYFFFLEETDYCRRVHEAGGRVAYCDDVSATHQLGASSKRRAPLATRIEFHRSLYRYLERQSGPGAAALARVVRGLRTAASLLALAPLGLLAPSARGRLSQRWGLLLWHLRGRPPSPSFAERLDAAPGHVEGRRG